MPENNNSDDKQHHQQTNVESAVEPYYFTTSNLKLALMSICTFGLYEIYWFYRNWIIIKKREDPKVIPIVYAFFAPLLSFYCFKQIKNSAAEHNVPESLSIHLLAILYFVFHALVKLPDPYWLVGMISFALIMPVNAIALKVNKLMVPNFKNNDSFSFRNWIGLVLGGAFFTLVVLATFSPEV